MCEVLNERWPLISKIADVHEHQIQHTGGVILLSLNVFYNRKTKLVVVMVFRFILDYGNYGVASVVNLEFVKKSVGQSSGWT